MDSRQAVLKYVNEADLVRLLQDLIRVPSVTGKEKGIAYLLKEILENLGLEVKLVEGCKDRPNVIGTLRGTVGRPVLLLHSHVDTVDEGDRQAWIVDPYSGELRGGKVYGRGAMDCKGGLASTIGAVKAIVDAGIRLQGNVVVMGEVGEETVEYCGMPYVTEKYVMPNVKPDMGIYNHPRTELKVTTCFKGANFLTITTQGKGVHASVPEHGVNAISRMVKIISAVERKGLSFKRHNVLGDCTFSFTTINGGVNYNIVADSCKATLNVRLVPGQTSKGLREELEQIFADIRHDDPTFSATIEFQHDEDPMELPTDASIVKIVRDSTKAVVGSYPPIAGEVGNGDLRALVNHGIPCLQFSPGGAGNLHKENEFIAVADLVTATKILALTILEACG